MKRKAKWPHGLISIAESCNLLFIACRYFVRFVVFQLPRQTHKNPIIPISYVFIKIKLVSIFGEIQRIKNSKSTKNILSSSSLALNSLKKLKQRNRGEIETTNRGSIFSFLSKTYHISR